MFPMHRSISRAAALLGLTLALAGDVHPQSADPRAPAAPGPVGSASSAQPGHAEPATPGRSRYPLYFTAPADAPREKSAAAGAWPSLPVRRYEFLQIDASGTTDTLRAYADSVGGGGLVPAHPGTRETAWIELTPGDPERTIVIVSHGWSGQPSGRSNSVSITAILRASASGAAIRAARTSQRPALVPAQDASVGGRNPR